MSETVWVVRIPKTHLGHTHVWFDKDLLLKKAGIMRWGTCSAEEATKFTSRKDAHIGLNWWNDHVRDDDGQVFGWLVRRVVAGTSDPLGATVRRIVRLSDRACKLVEQNMLNAVEKHVA